MLCIYESLIQYLMGDFDLRYFFGLCGGDDGDFHLQWEVFTVTLEISGKYFYGGLCQQNKPFHFLYLTRYDNL